jgi:hypothetical protein
MRSISANGLAKIAAKQGTEPVVILDIQWAEGGSVKRYGDIAIPSERVTGTIQEVSGLDNVITIQGVTQGMTGDTQQISVTLDDTDGEIKKVLDSTDVHKQPVWVYQWYKTLAFNDRFLLFKGQVSSPIEWHEGDRTVRFDVINQIEDAEYGFSIEEGNFTFSSVDLVGKAWPLCFGTPVNVPALQTRTAYQAVLKTGFGIYDFTLEKRLEQLKLTCCPLISAGNRAEEDPDSPDTWGGVIYVTSFMEDQDCYCRRLSKIAEWEAELALQKSHSIQVGQTIQILNGDKFPQNALIWISICNEGKLFGRFSGENFLVLDFKHPQKDTLELPEVQVVDHCVEREEHATGITVRGQKLFSGEARGTIRIYDVGCEPGDDPGTTGWDYLAAFPKADFWWAEPGCEVIMDGNEEIAYIANILPSTVHRVAAYRTFRQSGVRQLVSVPSDYYTIRFSNFIEYNVTEVVMNKPLSRRGEGYEDDIYVTLTSSVGPNTVDILEWLIDKYTNFSVDSTSFDAVKAILSDLYPMDFPLLQRGNILNLLQEIAFQQRCALILRNDTFFLIYLSTEPSKDIEITETDVLPKSFVMSHTETEELVTKLVAEWIPNHLYTDPNKAIFRYNIKKYGTQEQVFNFFAFKHYQLVEKTGTFWLIRMANTWRKVKCKTPLTKLQAEVFDIAEINLSDFSPSLVKCFIEKATYNSDKYEIEFELWTPVRSGEQEPYIFAWPAQIDISNIYPEREDYEQGRVGGSGPNLDVEPPNLHPLAPPEFEPGQTWSFSSGGCKSIASMGPGPSPYSEKCSRDQGDPSPSDKDDEKPESGVPGEGGGNVGTSKNPLGTKDPLEIENTTKNEEQDYTDNKQIDDANRPDAYGGAGGGGGGGGDPQDELPEEPTTECYACVRLCMAEIQAVKVNGGFSSEPGQCGTGPIFGAINIAAGCSIIYFDSLEGALAASEAWKAQGSEGCVGDYGIVPQLTGYLGSCTQWGRDCEEPASPGITAAERPSSPEAWEAMKDGPLGGT